MRQKNIKISPNQLKEPYITIMSLKKFLPKTTQKTPRDRNDYIFFKKFFFFSKDIHNSFTDLFYLPNK